jgi:tRNA A37 threonylcarbamoyladenosine modification protein TsaB
MKNQINNLEMGIDSSLSYCSLTVFKNQKILWNKSAKADFGHEQKLAKLLQVCVQELKISPKNIAFLHLNHGPARFTAIRNCHALVKGFFLNHPTKILNYNIFEHYFLGINKEPSKKIICILDTNRRDLAIQQINQKGKLIGKTVTYKIDESLKLLLQKDVIIMGNGVLKLKTMPEFKFLKSKECGPIHLKSDFFVQKFYDKKPKLNISKIIYPYAPI